jgi:hypothetical protein
MWQDHDDQWVAGKVGTPFWSKWTSIEPGTLTNEYLDVQQNKKWDPFRWDEGSGGNGNHLEFGSLILSLISASVRDPLSTLKNLVAFVDYSLWNHEKNSAGRGTSQTAVEWGLRLEVTVRSSNKVARGNSGFENFIPSETHSDTVSSPVPPRSSRVQNFARENPRSIGADVPRIERHMRATGASR